MEKMTSRQSESLVAEYAAQISVERIESTKRLIAELDASGQANRLAAVRVARCPRNWESVTTEDIYDAVRKIEGEIRFGLPGQHFGFVGPRDTNSMTRLIVDAAAYRAAEKRAELAE